MMLRRSIIVVVVLAAATVGLFCLFRPTTTTSDAEQSTKVAISSLYCQHDGLFDNHIFSTDDATSARHEVEAILYDDQLHDVTYTYTGEYVDPTAGTTAEAHIHVAVNNLISRLGVANSGLSPDYSLLGNTLTVRITATEATLSPATAPLVLLASTDSTDTPLPQGLAATKSIYTSQGFTCQTKNY